MFVVLNCLLSLLLAPQHLLYIIALPTPGLDELSHPFLPLIPGPIPTSRRTPVCPRPSPTDLLLLPSPPDTAKMYSREDKPRRSKSRKSSRTPLIRMDPDCAICHSAANLRCDCEAKALETAINHAENKMMRSMYQDIR